MIRPLDQIREEISRLKLDDSMLFLNHLLSVARDDIEDQSLVPLIRSTNSGVPAFVVHFLAKQLLLHASNLGPYPLDAARFKRLFDLYFELDDPIVGDPNWPKADPTGFLERFFAQQFPSQGRNFLQKYGLALGLFRDAGPINWPVVFDLRSELERTLNISVDQFMGLAHVCYAFRLARHGQHQCAGTFTPTYFAEAYRQGIELCVPELWGPFLSRIGCTRDKFRDVSNRPEFKADEEYTQFEFNPLQIYPTIDVGGMRYVAVDPDLIIHRATLGLFFDLFEDGGTVFSEKFGYVFNKFVGQLLGSVCDAEQLWSSSEWEQAASDARKARLPKTGDWAFIGEKHNILFECKSLRPSLELTMYGSNDSVQKVSGRFAAALMQLSGHRNSIMAGEWIKEGLLPRSTICVVVTFGTIQTANLVFFRRRLRSQLEGKGIAPPPFVVLSLEDIDSIIRLVELGHQLDDVIEALAVEENAFNPLRLFASDLKEKSVSLFTHRKASDFVNQIVTRPPKT